MDRRFFATLATTAGTILAMGGSLSEARAALNWDLSLGADAYFTDNLHLDPEPSSEEDAQPVQETSYSFAPEGWLEWEGPRDRLYLDYRGQYMTFTGDEELDPFWIHNLDAEFTWRRWSPFFLEATEAFRREPGSQEQDGVSIVDQIDSSSLSVRAGLFREWGTRTTAELAYRLEMQTYPGTEDADRTLGQYGEGSLSHHWTPLLQSAVSFSYGQLDRDLTPDAVEFRAAVSVDQRLSERLALHYGLEWVRDEGDEVAGDATPPGTSETPVETSLLKTLEVNGDFRTGGSWSLRYEDTLGYLSDGDTLKTGLARADVTLLSRLGSSLELGGLYRARDFQISGREEMGWGATVDARWVVAQWIALDLTGALTSTTIQEREQPEIDDHALLAVVDCVTVLGRHLTFEAGYMFRQNDSTDESRSYTANLLYAKLMYNFRAIPPGTIPESSIEERRSDR